MSAAPNILFAAGGTGGHVYPAIAVADALRRRIPDAHIRFAGTRNRMEWRTVPEAGYEIYPVTAAGLHRAQLYRNLALPFRLARSMAESHALVRKFNPDVAVGTGGYVSGPVLLAASLAGKPIVVQEQNAWPGLTNRLLGKRAAAIHVAFEEARQHFPSDRCLSSGNPVREELVAADREGSRRDYELPAGAFLIAVFGGSLGSRAINEVIAGNLETVLADESVHVIWQSGRRYFDEMRSRVPAHARLRLLEYVDRMDRAYAAADLVVCRSGALTCSELAITGTPAILIPSPNVAEDHQTHNARSMVAAGAAEMISESMIHTLPEAINRLRERPELLRDMSKAALDLARPDAADRIAGDVLRLAGFAEETKEGDNESTRISRQAMHG
ncbi:MAG: undecaprenyldiphospho-muramoylpentapeptide beta-N-acetylglucosaminyltransferase [Bacteroidetes bacterium SB0662_bin_6]|nr:undecaprenyldiphospho-muramoylpentapeptide beta-N-acetylglucosaminyltransferase [Bacteroidetes bacterium SB0668_bin_1]MYE05408.1 undecaprenyldiphospho-muramoylpentapeptide beta-N-acetylglucosaminyltransferase [Bacteroidetes bacterium SB0662_bin_6]